jgi:AcrR family transcriptional regulator
LNELQSIARQDADSSTRTRIRDASRRLFYDKGYQPTSVEEIARAAGVSRATVYLHYRTKDDVLFDMLREDLGDQLAHYERLAALKAVNKASVRKWLATFQRAMDVCRGSLNLFAVAFDLSSELKANVGRHRDSAIALLGRRFKGFDLDALDREARAAQNVKCYMMLFLVESAAITFSGSPSAPSMDLGGDQLAATLLHFLNEGEIRTDLA